MTQHQKEGSDFVKYSLIINIYVIIKKILTTRICRSVENFSSDLRMEPNTTYGSAPNLAPKPQLTVFTDNDDNNI